VLRSQQRGYSLKPVHSGTVPSMRRQFFGRPFIKRFALCYRTIVLSVCLVCLSVLSVCNVGVLWPNGWMDQDETCYRGRPLSRSHCVIDGDPALPLRCRVAKFSFRNRVVNERNRPILDEEIISGWSLAGFKRKLDRHHRDKRGYIYISFSFLPLYRQLDDLDWIHWCIKFKFKGAQSPNFRPMSIVAKRSPISATAEHLFYLLTARLNEVRW